MDATDYLRFVFALVFVLGLIGLLAALAKRYGLGYAVRGRNPRQRRLGVVEIMPLDGRRRLALVRRDDKEHLLLLGSHSETVVESGIPAAPTSFKAALDGTGTEREGPDA